ncbi:MAG: hypothetical protein ABIJ00_10530 [Candidatus Eisenbacteria bacterium]
MSVSPAASFAERIMVHVHDEDILYGDLLSIDGERLIFDPAGQITYQMVFLSEIDSVLTDEYPPMRIYPSGEYDDQFMRLPRKPSRHRYRDAFFSLSFFWSRRNPVDMFTINIGDKQGKSHPFAMKMQTGSGFGGSLGAFFPITKSGTSIGLELEVADLDADFIIRYVGESIGSAERGEMLALIDGDMRYYDAGLALKYPIRKGAWFDIFLTPSLGVGMRKITGVLDTVYTLEKHFALFASLDVEVVTASRLVIFAEIKAWNSEIEDLYGIDDEERIVRTDVPRYTTVEFRAATCLRIY